jgi:hypothetical protein
MYLVNEQKQNKFCKETFHITIMDLCLSNSAWGHSLLSGLAPFKTVKSMCNCSFGYLVCKFVIWNSGYLS